MNRKVLIISPYFPPSNAADMHRVRMSLPYFRDFGWDAEVVMVDEMYSDQMKDELLLQSIPPHIKIHKVQAFDKNWTAKLGLGSISLRSLWFYKRLVNQLLDQNKFDLIYFSTTQFPICILGPYWKKKFNIPYVIDMQDPWHSDYYRNKRKKERPPKYWFSYRMNKYLEPVALKKVDGLISVSDNYITSLKARYPEIKEIPQARITFGAFAPDIKIAESASKRFTSVLLPGHFNIVYTGRGGIDMHKAIKPVFETLRTGLDKQQELFSKIKFYFIGTSYASADKGIPSILPLAEQLGVAGNVVEITNRISYYHALITLEMADALFIPGSDDPQYTASKIYPYLLMQKPVLAIFNKNSNAVEILKKCTDNLDLLTFDDETEQLTDRLYPILEGWCSGTFKRTKQRKEFEDYSARNLTGKQVELFNKAIAYFERKNTNA